MNSDLRTKFRNLFNLALAAGMVFVYPVHVIVDHSGLFDHYTHHHDDHHSSDQKSDEDLCAFCLTLGSMEVSESQNLNFGDVKETNYVLHYIITGDFAIIGKSPRAPPVYF